MPSEQATYSHGHHESVVKTHARRTVENSAAFLIPHIQPQHRILDVGCGPGSITTGLARLANKGQVIGCDAVQEVLGQAETLAKEQVLSNISFQKVDANTLPFEDGAFDIVFCHQVLQHVGDPVGILKEMRRVTKPGGVVAAREADYKGFVWYPESEGLDRWYNLYQRVHKANGAEPNAGRYLPQWARQAGFGAEAVTFSWDTWQYQQEEAKVFGGAWVDRARYSAFSTTAKKYGLASDEEIEEISEAWAQFAAAENLFIIIPNGEILCRA